MVVTNQESTQYAAIYSTTPPALEAADQYYGKLRVLAFDHTQSGAGDAGSTVKLVKIFPGQGSILLALSGIGVSALGAARTADLGWAAYVDQDGAAVAADPNGLDDGTDVSAAVFYNPVGTLLLAETKRLQSRDGVDIEIQINDGTIPDAATINGYLVVAVE